MNTKERALQEAKEVKEALEWALNNCSIIPELQSDLFNILTNAVTSAERLIEDASSNRFSLEDMWALGVEIADWKDGYTGRSDGRTLDDVIKNFIQSIAPSEPTEVKDGKEVEFAEWMNEVAVRLSNGHWCYGKDPNNNRFSTQDLLKIFLNQQSKK